MASTGRPPQDIQCTSAQAAAVQQDWRILIDKPCKVRCGDSSDAVNTPVNRYQIVTLNALPLQIQALCIATLHGTAQQRLGLTLTQSLMPATEAHPTYVKPIKPHRLCSAMSLHDALAGTCLSYICGELPVQLHHMRRFCHQRNSVYGCTLPSMQYLSELILHVCG